MKSVDTLIYENPNLQAAVSLLIAGSSPEALNEWDRFRRMDSKRERDDRSNIVAYIRDWASLAEEESSKEIAAGYTDDYVGFQTSSYVLYDLADAIEQRKDIL